MTSPKLSMHGLGKTFQADQGPVIALQGVNLDIGDNEFVSIVGTSGCGKSTLLSIAAGLERHDAGSITIDGANIEAPGLIVGWCFKITPCCHG
jgi:NitT/TauT family transport system ATP-binding protein